MADEPYAQCGMSHTLIISATNNVIGIPHMAKRFIAEGWFMARCFSEWRIAALL